MAIHWSKHPDPNYLGLLVSNEGQWLIEHRFEPLGREWRFMLPNVSQPVAEDLFRRFCVDPIGFRLVLAKHKAAQECVSIQELGARYLAQLNRKGRDSSRSRKQIVDLTVRRLLEILGNPPIAEVTLGDAQLVEEAIHQDGLMDSTRALYVRTMRTLWNWAIKSHWAAENPFHGIEVPKDNPRAVGIPRVVTQEEIEQLFPKKEDEPFRLYIQTLWITGCRPVEPRRLSIKSLHTYAEDAELLVTAFASKTSQARRIPISGTRAVYVLAKFLVTHSELLVSERQVRKRLDEEFKRLNMPRCPLGGLRHSRITLWVNEGHSDLQVSKWAGTSLTYLRNNYFRSGRDVNPAWPAPAMV